MRGRDRPRSSRRRGRRVPPGGRQAVETLLRALFATRATLVVTLSAAPPRIRIRWDEEPPPERTRAQAESALAAAPDEVLRLALRTAETKLLVTPRQLFARIDALPAAPRLELAALLGGRHGLAKLTARRPHTTGDLDRLYWSYSWVTGSPAGSSPVRES